MDQNQAQNLAFCHFFKFGSLVFLDIAQDCSWVQSLSSSRKKNFVTQIGAKMIFSILMLLRVHSNLLVFVVFFVDFIIFMFMFIITQTPPLPPPHLPLLSVEMGCSLIGYYLVFQGLLQLLCLMFSDLSRLKFLQVYLQFLLIHYFDD